MSESEPEFSPDGTRIAYTADPGTPFLFQLFVMDLATRRAVQLTRETVNVHRPAWSPEDHALR